MERKRQYKSITTVKGLKNDKQALTNEHKNPMGF